MFTVVTLDCLKLGHHSLIVNIPKLEYLILMRLEKKGRKKVHSVAFPGSVSPRQRLYKPVLPVNCALCALTKAKGNNSPHGCGTGKLHSETRSCLSETET